jgi:ectoine hydroxylase-related dioxygenase (phytanoyl-CoA dioxygenase family)
MINLAKKDFLNFKVVAESNYNILTRGYTILEDFLDDQEVLLLKKGMETGLLRYKTNGLSERSSLDKYQLHDLMIQDINFARLLEDPRLQQLIAPHLGEYWIMYAMTSSSIPPYGQNYASRLHVDCPRFYPGYIFNMGFIWTLDDYTEENGALKILPGSQHTEIAPDFDFFEKNSVQILCKSGSLILFNAKTYHRTCENHSNKWSHSMTLNACRSFMKQRMDWVKFIPKEITDQLNPQARRLIGFDTRIPSSLEEFFVPDDLRLYKPNQG